MADVSERGQLIIVGALVIAVLFVTVGLLLNFVIFTENLATRDTNQELRQTTQDQADAIDGVSRALRYVNLNERDNLTVLTWGLQNETRALTEQFERNGALGETVTTIQLISLNSGTRLEHTNESRAFRSAENESDWEVAEHIKPKVVTTSGRIKNPYYLEQTINRSDLFQANASTTEADLDLMAYNILIEEVDTSGLSPTLNRSWQVFVFSIQGSDQVVLHTVRGGLGTETVDQIADDACMTNKSQPTIRLVKGTFGGSACPRLDFYPEHIDTTNSDIRVNIKYGNTDVAGVGQAKGTYELLIEEDSPDNLGGSDHDLEDNDVTNNYNDLGNGSPFSHKALFWAEVDLVHATSDTEYEVQQIVLPSTATRKSLPGFPPTFDTCDVIDNSGGGTAEYTFDWRVIDLDGNLQEVQFFLYDHNDDVRRNSTTISVSGESASDSNNPVFQDGSRDASGDNYTARMTVVDDAGNTNTLSVTDSSDGTDPVEPTC